MPIQSHARFQSKRVTRGEAARKNSLSGAKISSVEQFVPKLLSLIRCCVNFKTIFTCVAGSGNDRGHAINSSFSEVIVLQRIKRNVRQWREYGNSIGTLK